MCGILGIVATPGAAFEQQANFGEAMATMAHRGPDGQQHWHDDMAVLGHWRLAIFDAHDRSAQPMQWRQWHIVFNGAIYNYLEIKLELQGLGHDFQTQSDTEVVLHAFVQWGAECVGRFRGMWALAIWDSEEKRCFLSRDRYGIKPLYYAIERGVLAFASEIKALRKLGFGQNLHPTRNWEFLAFGWQDHTTDTLWEGIRQAPAGCNAFFAPGNQQLDWVPYYRLPQTALTTMAIGIQEAQTTLRALLDNSLRYCTRADVPWGITLSGGLDSSTLAGLLRLQLGQEADIAAFSALFPNTAINEAPYAADVAAQHRLTWHKVYPDWDFTAKHLDDTLLLQDEPIASSAVVCHLPLMQKASELGYKVLLAGQGADEILAGYDKFFVPLWKSLARGNAAHLAMEIFLATLKGSISLRDGFGKLSRQNRIGIQAEWLAAPVPAHLFQRLADTDVRACSANLIQGIGLPVLLHYEDRNAMAHGIEMRVPMLDHELVDFALSLPAEYKIRYGERKYLLRRAAADVLPKSVLHRHKKLGFATPQAQWMRQHKAFFLQSIEDGQQRFPEWVAPKAAEWAATVLSNARSADYPAVWRLAIWCRWAAIGNG